MLSPTTVERLGPPRRPGAVVAVLAVAAVLAGWWLLAAPSRTRSAQTATISIEPFPVADPDSPDPLLAAGPYGTGSHGPILAAITEVQDIGLLSITVALTNEDPNDAVTIENRDLLLTVDGGDRVIPAEVTSGARRSTIEPGATVSRTLGYEVVSAIGLDRLAIQLGSESVPTRIPLLSPAPPIAYPVEARTLQADTTVTAAPCSDATIDLHATRVALDVNLPLAVDLPASVDGRAPAGHRWLIATVEVSAASDLNCADGWTLTNAGFALTTDGAEGQNPVFPVVGGAEQVVAGQAQTVLVAWPIPTPLSQAETQAAVAIGGDAEAFRFAIPPLPRVPGN